MSNSARLVQAYAPDTWDHYWTDPQSLPSGWTVDTTGTDPDTVATYEAVGDGYNILLTADANGYPSMSQTFAGLTSSATVWEAAIEMKVLNTGSSYRMFRLSDGEYRYAFRAYSTTGYYQTPGSVAAFQVNHALAVDDWITVTVRRQGAGILTWIGPQLVGVTPRTALYTTTDAGVVVLGHPDVLGVTSRIRRFGLKIGGYNEAPERKYAGTTHGR